MDIVEFIRKEAPDYEKLGSHDFYYGKELLYAYDRYFNYSKGQLQDQHNRAKAGYDGTHKSVAACMVLYGLLKGEI